MAGETELPGGEGPEQSAGAEPAGGDLHEAFGSMEVDELIEDNKRAPEAPIGHMPNSKPVPDAKPEAGPKAKDDDKEDKKQQQQAVAPPEPKKKKDKDEKDKKHPLVELAEDILKEFVKGLNTDVSDSASKLVSAAWNGIKNKLQQKASDDKETDVKQEIKDGLAKSGDKANINKDEVQAIVEKLKDFDFAKEKGLEAKGNEITGAEKENDNVNAENMEEKADVDALNQTEDIEVNSANEDKVAMEAPADSNSLGAKFENSMKDMEKAMADSSSEAAPASEAVTAGAEADEEAAASISNTAP